MVLKVEGYIDEDGKLALDLPVDLPKGRVAVTIEPILSADETWTDEELAEALRPPDKPVSGAEIVQMIHDFGPTEWMNIPDGEAWVEEQRAKRKARNRW